MNSKAQDILSSILLDGADVHRCAAARAFGTTGLPGATEVLTKALLDEDSDVRTDAAQALLTLKDPAAAAALMESLIGDPEPDVKKAALSALIALRHAPVLDLIRKLAVSRCDEIVWDEDEFYSDGWDSWLDIQIVALKGLAEFGMAQDTEVVLTAMADEMGQDLSEIGVGILARLGEDGAEALTGLFEISDTQLRRRIAEAAVQSENPDIAPLVLQMLASDSAQIRKIAVSGLEADDVRLDPLLEDPDAGVRAAVVTLAGVHLASRLGDMITDPDPLVSIAVLDVIASNPKRFPGKDLRKSVQMAISGDPETARHAALALVALRGPSTAKGLAHTMTNIKVPLAFRVGAVEAMRKAGPGSVPYLVPAVADDARQLRLAAMTALAGFAATDPVWPNAAGEALLGALNGEMVEPPEEDPEALDDVEDLQEEIVEEDKAVVAEAEQEIDESTPLVAEPVAEDQSTLGAIISGGKPIETIPAEPIELTEKDLRLLDLSKQRKMGKRKMSLEADVVPYIDVRRFAASLLGDVVNPEVTERLIAVLDGSNPDFEEEALGSIAQHAEQSGRLTAEAMESLSRYLETGKSELRVLALRAMARVEGQEAEGILRDHLEDSDPLVRAEAVRGLDVRGIADDRIEACLKDSYLGVGLAAANALARNRGEGAVNALVDFAFRNDGTYRRDVGKLLGTYARDAGERRLIDVLGDAGYRRNWLVAIDALAEVLSHCEPPAELRVA